MRWSATLLLLVLCGTVVAPLTCAGWEASPSERMACCKRAQHGPCDEQRAADNCCAAQEQTRQPGSTMAAAHEGAPADAVTLATATFDSSVLDVAAATIVDRALAQRLHDPPGFHALPLRI